MSTATEVDFIELRLSFCFNYYREDNLIYCMLDNPQRIVLIDINLFKILQICRYDYLRLPELDIDQEADAIIVPSTDRTRLYFRRSHTINVFNRNTQRIYNVFNDVDEVSAVWYLTNDERTLIEVCTFALTIKIRTGNDKVYINNIIPSSLYIDDNVIYTVCTEQYECEGLTGNIVKYDLRTNEKIIGPPIYNDSGKIEVKLGFIHIHNRASTLVRVYDQSLNLILVYDHKNPVIPAEEVSIHDGKIIIHDHVTDGKQLTVGPPTPEVPQHAVLHAVVNNCYIIGYQMMSDPEEKNQLDPKTIAIYNKNGRLIKYIADSHIANQMNLRDLHDRYLGFDSYKSIITDNNMYMISNPLCRWKLTRVFIGEVHADKQKQIMLMGAVSPNTPINRFLGDELFDQHLISEIFKFLSL